MGCSKRVCFLYPDPPTMGLIARPVTRDMVLNVRQYPQDQLLYIYDHRGDVLWMDFLWAPGQYETVMEFLRLTGKKLGGWEHRATQRPHIVQIESLLKHHTRLLGQNDFFTPISRTKRLPH